MWTQPSTWLYLVTLIVNFFLVVVAFFGEEYGWRYYLQPLLQRRFGLRKGGPAPGVIWGTVAPASGFLLLHHTGYGSDLPAVSDRYLCLYGDLPGVCLYEDQEYLGSGGCSLHEQQSDPYVCGRLFRRCASGTDHLLGRPSGFPDPESGDLRMVPFPEAFPE